MTPIDVLHTLESDLQLRGGTFTRADLQEFVSACWPLIEDEPDVGSWAGEFLERIAAEAIE